MTTDSTPMKRKTFVPGSLEEKLATGGFLTVRDEFLRWSGLCITTIYKEVAAGDLKLTKIRGKSVVAAEDAFSWRDRKRGITA
jgi:hypothetical protein